MLEREFKYFVEHQDELVERYAGKVLVIVGEEVVGAYDSVGEAYLQARKEYELGTFLIQECQPGEEAYTVEMYSSMAFA